ncbi:hypothetical protein JOE55_001790 [Kocuria palustris]|nr:hypothetical protein [Kocuria palustris]
MPSGRRSPPNASHHVLISRPDRLGRVSYATRRPSWKPASRTPP